MNRSTTATVLGGAGILGASALGIALMHDTAQAAPTPQGVTLTQHQFDTLVAAASRPAGVATAPAAIVKTAKCVAQADAKVTPAVKARGTGPGVKARGVGPAVIYRVAYRPAPKAQPTAGPTTISLTQIVNNNINMVQDQGQSQTQTQAPAPSTSPTNIPTPTPSPKPTPTGSKHKDDDDKKKHDGKKTTHDHGDGHDCTCAHPPRHHNAS